MVKLTQDQVDEYVKVKGESCPKCKSPEVITDSMLFYDEDSNKVYQDKTCLTCDLEWTDVWGLESIKQLEIH